MPSSNGKQPDVAASAQGKGPGDPPGQGFPSIADTFAMFGDNKWNAPKEMLTGSTQAEELFARTEIDDPLRGTYLRILANWDYWRDDYINMAKIIALDANMLMSRDRKSRLEVKEMVIGMARMMGRQGMRGRFNRGGSGDMDA